MPDRMVWTGPDGSTVDLTDWGAGFFQTEGATGMQSPAWALSTSQLAGVDVVSVDALRAGPREVSLPMYLRAGSKQELRMKLRGLVHTMRPKAGAGALRVSTEWGTSRTLNCYCTGGLEGDTSLKIGGTGPWWRCVLKLFAADPWWYGDPVTVGFGLAEPAIFWSTTLPQPRSLSSSSIQGQRDIDLSDSDDPTPGLWTITGPGVGLTLTRQLLLPDGTVDPAPTATRSLVSSAAIPDGVGVVIRTKFGQQSIRRGDGTNLGGTLAAGSTFWSLVDGRVNRVSIQLGGAGGASKAEMVYQPKFGGS